jgi:phenylalanyl-tRNA synthetase beta chain
MRVSLNWIKKYIDLPERLTPKDIAYDLTLRTVEVESVENTSEKYHDIVVGKILEIKNHPNADLLKICIVDIGENSPVQIVCGGSNLYEGEMVVVSKPGAEVYWHGEGELVKIKETKMRGEDSYGMICGATEVFLDKFFPPKDEKEIVDLKDVECHSGQNIADLLGMDDVVLEIDNKSLTNRPDLWGHLGIARELSAIYNIPLKELPKYEIDKDLPKYDISIEDSDKCRRYVAVKIDNVYDKESPKWMQTLLVNVGLRPINAIVDITNYVMMAVGQPTHAFDCTHVEGNKIVVRNAKKGEKLLLLDDNYIELDEDDLVICDMVEPMALAGIKGGKKDSILPETKGIVLEVANFSATTIRKTDKKFDEKTDAAIRYEKNIDTERVSVGVSLALSLFKELFPKSEVVAYNDVYPTKTEREVIDVPEDFLNNRLGKVLDKEVIINVLTKLGYEVTYSNGNYHVIVPVWRSTGDVSIKDDVMGDIARLLSYESFEAKPLPVNFEHAVLQNKVLLERRIREYLAYRCGFNEIFTYPWIDEKYINAAKIDTSKCVTLATPPAPELRILRSSLIPGLLEAISKNLRYYEDFKLFEMTQVYEKGEYHESSDEEILPIHKKLITGSIVSKDAKKIFYEAKGVLEELARFCHMEKLSFDKREKPTWADINGYLNIISRNEIIGSLGLLSIRVMDESKIKYTNVVVFELNFDKLIPFASRTNEYKNLPQFPLVEKDLSLLVDDNILWDDISKSIKNKVKELAFIDEYRGDQVPEGKKSITLRFKIGYDDRTMNTEEINNAMHDIIDTLSKKCNAIIRDK